MLSGCSGLPKFKIPKSTSGSTSKSEVVVKQQKFKVSEKTNAAYKQALKQMYAKNYEQAIIEMKRVAKMDKRISGPWVNIGLAYRELGNVKQAKSSFEKALKINPQNSYALNQLAIMSREEGNFDKAEELYRKAISAHPNYQNAHLNLGILCDLYLRKIDCAIEHYQEYLSLTGGRDKQVASWVTQLKKQGS